MDNRRLSMFDVKPNMQGDSFQPRQTGFLGGLGQALSGFAAPMLPGGQENWLKQQALQQAQAEQDYNQWIKQQELTSKKMDIDNINKVTALSRQEDFGRWVSNMSNMANKGGDWEKLAARGLTKFNTPQEITSANTIIDNLRQSASRKDQSSKEDRLNINTRLSNLRAMGGAIDETFLKDATEKLGIDFAPQLEAGRGVPTVDKDGKRTWRVLSDTEFQKKIDKGYLDIDEQKYMDNLVEDSRNWSRVKSMASDLGIGPENLDSLGKMEFDVVNTPYGPASIPARFKLAAQYIKDPKYNALKQQVEQAFQSFRIRVTGAQAGLQELKMLREIIPSLTDRPSVFFSGIDNILSNNKDAYDTKLNLWEKYGRDVSKFREQPVEAVTRGIENKDTTPKQQESKMSDDEAYAQYLKMVGK